MINKHHNSFILAACMFNFHDSQSIINQLVVMELSTGEKSAGNWNKRKNKTISRDENVFCITVGFDWNESVGDEKKRHQQD